MYVDSMSERPDWFTDELIESGRDAEAIVVTELYWEAECLDTLCDGEPCPHATQGVDFAVVMFTQAEDSDAQEPHLFTVQPELALAMCGSLLRRLGRDTVLDLCNHLLLLSEEVVP